jgi:hypothetical protein
MKYFYLAVGIVLLIAIMIVFFQLFAGSMVFVPFFTKWIDIINYTVAVIFLSLFAGIFMTLAISKFLS